MVQPTILSCVEVVGILIQQANVSNYWLIDSQYFTLASYQLE